MSDASAAVSVPLTTLDAFCEREAILNKIAFVKIDVQGYEAAVCRGMEQILKESPQVKIALEYMPSALASMSADGRALLSWFSERGFRFALSLVAVI